MTEHNKQSAQAQEQEFFKPEELFRPIDEIRRNAPPLEPLWGYFLFRKAITSIVGDPGVCKCVDENTLVPLENGKLVPIKDCCELHRILSLNKDLKIQLDSPIKLSDEGYKDCIEIVINSGKRITITPEHPFLKVDGWQRADELSVGDKIATPRKLPIEGNVTMPEHEVKLLAYFITEGSLHNQGSPCFTSGEEKMVSEFYDCVAQYPELAVRETEEKGNCKTYRVVAIQPKRTSEGYLKKNRITLFLQQHGLWQKKSADKLIPSCIFQLSNKQLAVFLNRMFAGDGCPNELAIEYYSTSKKLTFQLQHLLLRFGIISKVSVGVYITEKEKVYNGCTLYITDVPSVIKFIQEIGIFTRREKLNNIFSILSSKKRNPNLDTIPMTLAEMSRIRRVYDTPIKETISRERLKRLEPENILVDSDIFWDKIVSIKPVGAKHVWDISMPNFNFVANDFFAHNTTFGYGLAKSLCLGQLFLDITAEESINSLYMDFESADSLVASRANLVLGDSKVPNLYVYNIVDYYLPQIAQVTIEFCKEHNINLVFIDNQSMAFNTRDENDNAEAVRQMRFIRKLASALDAAIIVFHHTSKGNLPGTRKGTGAYARARLADICINLETSLEDSADIVRLEVVKNRLVDEKVLWYIKKEEGKFTFIEPPLGAIGQPTSTQIYKAQEQVLVILRRNSSKEKKEVKFQELTEAMMAVNFSESWTDHAVRRLLQQNRIYKPRYGYYAITVR